MRTSGFTGAARALAMAAGLALAGLGTAVSAAAPAAVPQQGVSGVPNVSNIAPTTSTATPAAAPASPLLAEDGAPPMSPSAGIGHPVDAGIGIQPQVTKNGDFAHWFHNSVLFPLISLISIFVLILLVIVVVRFRAARHQTPSKTSHNTGLEIAWTLIPVVILVLIAIPSIGLLQAQFKPAPANAVTLKAIGNQWYWSYQYPDNGGFEITANLLKEKNEVGKGERYRTAADGPRLLAADNRVVLPVGVPIRLITTSQDVIHSWAVPAFWIKLDAVPGRLNETSFTIEKPGLYFGQCSELCGARHGYMPIAVEAVPPAQFAAWVRAKGGTVPAGKLPFDDKSSIKMVPSTNEATGGIPSAPTPRQQVQRTEARDVRAVTGPTENATTVAIPTSQGATQTAPAGPVGR